MGSPLSFCCPNCAAPLPEPDSSPTVKCDFCHSRVAVPLELRKPANNHRSYEMGTLAFMTFGTATVPNRLPWGKEAIDSPFYRMGT